MFNLVLLKPEGKEQARRLGSNSLINVINFHTSNLLFPLPHVQRFLSVSAETFGFQAAQTRRGEGGRSWIYSEGDSAENKIIRITLSGFLLHFLFDLLRSPKGSWVATEDSTSLRATPADVSSLLIWS